uniref:Uncharacterized protein n=1 Tax=Arundo donax TaxID=35708 RepID=A0A0A9AR84_ARUDO
MFGLNLAISRRPAPMRTVFSPQLWRGTDIDSAVESTKLG